MFFTYDEKFDIIFDLTFSKKIENHIASVALYMMYYNSRPKDTAYVEHNKRVSPANV